MSNEVSHPTYRSLAHEIKKKKGQDEEEYDNSAFPEWFKLRHYPPHQRCVQVSLSIITVSLAPYFL